MSAKPQRPLRTIVFVTVSGILLYETAVTLMVRSRVMEHILAPTTDGLLALALTAAFLLFRIALIFLLPAWIAARLVLVGLRRISRGGDGHSR